MENNKELEIDLKEAWDIVVKRKVMILIITFIVTGISTFYALNIKAPRPMYIAEITFEMGKGQKKNLDIIPIDKVPNIDVILKSQYERNETFCEISVDSISNSDFFVLRIKDRDENKILSHIGQVIDVILNRHNELSRLFTNFVMTKQIDKIKVSTEVVTSLKKKIILSGFVLGLFLAILFTFLSYKRKS